MSWQRAVFHNIFYIFFIVHFHTVFTLDNGFGMADAGSHAVKHRTVIGFTYLISVLKHILGFLAVRWFEHWHLGMARIIAVILLILG